MDGRQLLKNLRDEDWYLGDSAGPCRQYIHPEHAGVITVCVRHTDELGPETEKWAKTAAESDVAGEPRVVVETTRTGASAYSPDLPGCTATGTDEAEVRARLASALVLHQKALAGS